MSDPRQTLARDGFAVVPSVVPEDRCAEVRANDVESPRARAGRRLRLEDAAADGWADLLEVMSDLARTAVAEDTAALGLRPVRAIRFDKAADANWLVPWHQDRTVALDRRDDAAADFGPWSIKAGVPHAAAPSSLLARMLTVRLHLDDCPDENGPLLVVPGSHAPAWDGRRPDDPDAEAVACTARTGDCVLMRPLLWHASRKATRPTRRRVLHVEFGPPEPGAGLQWAEARDDGRRAARC